MKKRFSIIFILSLFILEISLPFFSFALEINYPSVPGALSPNEIEECVASGDCEPTQRLALYVKYFYNFFIIISGFVCFIAFVRGGLLCLTAFGNVSKMREGLNYILAGISGTTLILFSYGLLLLLNPELTILSLEPPPPITEESEEEKPEISEELASYIEVPMGGYIETTKQWAEILKDEARDVWMRTSQKGINGFATIPELVICLKILTDECNCSQFDTVGCELDEDASNGCVADTSECEAAENDPEDPSTYCCEERDPCDITREEEEGMTYPRYDPPIRYLCSPDHSQELLDICEENPEWCLDENSLDDLGTDNLREAIDKIRKRLECLMQEVSAKEIPELLEARRKLYEANARLKVGEVFIRDALGEPVPEDLFAGFKNKTTEHLFPYEAPYYPVAGSSICTDTEDQSLPIPPIEGQGECLQEIIPACTYCADGDLLVCHGNDYRCLPTNPIATQLCQCRGPNGQSAIYNLSCIGHPNEINCVQPPPVYQQPSTHPDDEYNYHPPSQQGACCRHRAFGRCNKGDPPELCNGGCHADYQQWGCCAPRHCRNENVWFPQSEVGQTLLFNGVTYNVPLAGVVILGSNVVNCNWFR